MIIRALTPTGDWTFGHGEQDYLRNNAAIALNVQTRLKSFLNDAFWEMNFGIDWWNLLGTRNPTAQSNIVLQCRRVIIESFGVVKINSVSAETDRITRKLTVTFDIDTIFTRNLVGVVTP